MNQQRTIPVVNPAITADWISAHATGRGVRVAVVDSGIDTAHPQLTGKVTLAGVVQNVDGQACCNAIPLEQCRDSFGHGTGVAGVIASLAPGGELVSVRVLNEYNSATGEALVAAFAWALEQEVDIVNLSLATSRKAVIPRLFELCEQAYCQDTLIVSSKRNFGDLGCPAMFSTVISVDNEKGFEHFWQLRHISRSTIEFSARGTNVTTAAPGGGSQIQTGTSFATPHVVGICALLRELFPRMNSWEAKSILKSLAVSE